MGNLYVGDTGKVLRVSTKFDMSAFTELSVVFTKPNGKAITKTTADGVVLGTGQVVDADLGTLAANEYVEYPLEAGLLDSPGDWQVYAIYTNTTATPDDIYHSDPATMTVLSRTSTSTLEGNYVVYAIARGSAKLTTGGAHTTVLTKQPADVMLIDVDCSDAMSDSEQITAITSISCVSATGSGATTDVGFDTHVATDGTPAIVGSGTRVRTLLDGGTDKVTYKCKVVAVTNINPVREFDFYLCVSDV